MVVSWQPADRALNGTRDGLSDDTHRANESPSPRARRAWPRKRTWSVVGGGPAGMSRGDRGERAAALRSTLLERYNHLGGLASGGMVLVLDDMWDSHHERSRCAASA